MYLRGALDKESNMCFGMGGAGTWSDGKLTTRIGRNSEEVRAVLEAFVELGAPPEILKQGQPHSTIMTRLAISTFYRFNILPFRHFVNILARLALGFAHHFSSHLSGKPHLGTDRMVKMLRNMRRALEAKGVILR